MAPPPNATTTSPAICNLHIYLPNRQQHAHAQVVFFSDSPKSKSSSGLQALEDKKAGYEIDCSELKLTVIIAGQPLPRLTYT